MMSYKSIIKRVLLGSGVAFIVSLAVAFLTERDFDLGLRSTTLEAIVLSLGFFSLITSVLSLVLYFRREEIFRSWLKFIKWYLPITAVIIAWSAMSRSGGGWGMPNFFDSEMMSWFTAVLFLVISLILIIKKRTL